MLIKHSDYRLNKNNCQIYPHPCLRPLHEEFLVHPETVWYALCMSEAWDTIIIGAGIGGLTAAACLVRAGKRVLVLDRNPHPGGTAYVYHRKAFSFPMGPLGFSQSRLVKDTLQDLGENRELNLDRVRYRIKAYDLDIPLSRFHR